MMHYEFNVGDAVKIVRTRKDSYRKTIGYIGKIRRRHEYMGVNSYAV